MDAPLYTSLALGQRRFRISPDGKLYSLNHSIGTTLESRVWTSDWTQARCAYETHSAPSDDCFCGLYSFHLDTPLWQRVSAQIPLFGEAAAVVQARGDLQVYRTGFRAEEMRIVTLLRPAPWRLGLRRQVDLAAQRLDVPVVSPRRVDPEQFAGVAVPQEARPQKLGDLPWEGLAFGFGFPVIVCLFALAAWALGLSVLAQLFIIAGATYIVLFLVIVTAFYLVWRHEERSH